MSDRVRRPNFLAPRPAAPVAPENKGEPSRTQNQNDGFDRPGEALSLRPEAPLTPSLPSPPISREQIDEVARNFDAAIKFDKATASRKTGKTPATLSFDETRTTAEESAFHQLLEVPISALDAFFAASSMIEQGRAFIKARTNYTNAEKALTTLKTAPEADAEAINAAELRLAQAKEALMSEIRTLGVSSLEDGGELIARGAEWLGEVVPRVSGEHLGVAAEAVDAAFFPLRLLELKSAASALFEASSEAKGIREEINRLKSNNGDELLITILDLKATYLENIGVAQKLAILVQRLLNVSHGATGVAGLGLKYTALTLTKVIIAKVAWPFTLGAVGLIAGYAALFEKANLGNFFGKIPDHINLFLLNRQLTQATTEDEKVNLKGQITALENKMALKDLEAEHSAKAERMGISQEEYDETRVMLYRALEESPDSLAAIDEHVRITGNEELIAAFEKDAAQALMDYMFT